MVLEIELGHERERRLKKHLEKEHPSTKGRMELEDDYKKIMFKKKKGFGSKRQIKKIIKNIPDFAQQQRDFIKI